MFKYFHAAGLDFFVKESGRIFNKRPKFVTLSTAFSQSLSPLC